MFLTSQRWGKVRRPDACMAAAPAIGSCFGGLVLLPVAFNVEAEWGALEPAFWPVAIANTVAILGVTLSALVWAPRHIPTAEAAGP